MSFSTTEARYLSLDPGVVNLGWSVVSWRSPGLVSVITYGVYRFEKDLDILENLEQFCAGFPFKGHKEGLFDKVIVEDQPYIQNSNDAMRNFKLHQIQMGIHGMCMGAGLSHTKVGPRKARTELGICTGDYALNKKMSIEFCTQKLGTEFTEVPAALRNHVADTVMLAYWLISKGLGLQVLDPNNGTTQNSVWIPPERWTNGKTLCRNTRSSSTDKKRGRRPARTPCLDVSCEQIREQPGQDEPTVGSGRELGVSN